MSAICRREICPWVNSSDELLDLEEFLRRGLRIGFAANFGIMDVLPTFIQGIDMGGGEEEGGRSRFLYIICSL